MILNIYLGFAFITMAAMHVSFKDDDDYDVTHFLLCALVAAMWPVSYVGFFAVCTVAYRRDKR